MRAILVLVAAAVAVGTAGCAPWIDRPFAGLRSGADGGGDGGVLAALRPTPASAACSGGPWPSRMEPDDDEVRIGPLTFPGLGYPYPPARFAAGSAPLTVPVVVPARTRATITIPNRLRPVVGLDSGSLLADAPSNGHGALVCQAGETFQVYKVAFVLSGARCVPVSVTAGGRTVTREVGFGRPGCDT